VESFWEGILGSVVVGGKEGVEGSRMVGRVMSAERSRILAVAVMPWRGVDFWRPVVRMGCRKEGCGGGRPRVVREWVSCWRVGGWAILVPVGWKSEVMVHVVNWEEVDGSEGSSKSQAFEIE